MGDWRNNPANNSLTGGGEWWENPVTQDELMKQKLMTKGVPPDQIEQIMQQVTMAKGLQAKSEMTDGLPVGQVDTLSAQEGFGGPPAPGVAGPGEPQVAGGGVMGPPAPGGAQTPSSPPAAGESFLDRIGPEGMSTLLNQGGIDEQREQAMYLRNKEGPTGVGGIGLSTGGTAYVAANPLSHLASGVEKYRAKKDIKRLREEEKAGNKLLIDILRGKTQEPRPGAGRVM